MKIIVSKNCGPATFFRDPLEYLLISEGDETGKYIFDLCFHIGLADTGRPHREPEVGGRAGTTSEAGRKQAGIGAGPQGALLNWQKDERKR